MKFVFNIIKIVILTPIFAWAVSATGQIEELTIDKYRIAGESEPSRLLASAAAKPIASKINVDINIPLLLIGNGPALQVSWNYFDTKSQTEWGIPILFYQKRFANTIDSSNEVSTIGYSKVTNNFVIDLRVRKYFRPHRRYGFFASLFYRLAYYDGFADGGYYQFHGKGGAHYLYDSYVQYREANFNLVPNEFSFEFRSSLGFSIGHKYLLDKNLYLLWSIKRVFVITNKDAQFRDRHILDHYEVGNGNEITFFKLGYIF